VASSSRGVVSGSVIAPALPGVCAPYTRSTVDIFSALAETHRREILDALISGEKAVGTIVTDLSLSQPQVSKHLRVLSEVGLVTARAEGRRRLYSLEPARLQTFQEWLSKYEQALNALELASAAFACASISERFIITR
jgi:DNA-binding transcriptional ArsR family regulator